ncbi:ATP-binding protein [Aquabacterium sp.]|uniref:hybrid sensor histidine kinase/response regulator n=1 Tax=Aquabacterium sp. TaxID=1872578 RepID=UPI0035B38E3B
MSSGSHPAGRAQDSANAQRIFAEQVRELHNQRLTTIPSSIVTTLVIAGIMSGQAAMVAIVQWLGAMLAAQLLTIVSVLAYRRNAPPQARARFWARLQGVNTALTGAAWGSLVLFIWPGDELYRLLLIMLLAGISAVASVGAASLKRAALGLLVPIWTLVLLRLSLESAPFYRSLSWIVLLFLVVMSATSYRIHLILLDSIRLRCINLDLIADLRVQKTRAQAADRAKTGFLAAASHDLRQPVHALGLLLRVLDTLVRHVKPDLAQIQQVVGQSRQALHGLSHLLAALLDISRLDAGVVEIRPEPLNLQAFFEQLRSEFGPEAQRRGLQLRFHPTQRVVISDAVALKRVLGNFIGNALRYTSRGGVLIAARVRQAGEIGETCIEVWDTGTGIPESALETIFEEFVQLGNSERKREQGLGLGLAIVRRLAGSQGQRVTVRSRVGRGSVFRLHIPSPAAPTHSAGEWPARSASTHSAPSSGMPRRLRSARSEPSTFDMPTMPPQLELADYVLMLIDDDPDVLGATAALVGSQGLSVLTAESLHQALRHPGLPRVDALLVDFRLPGGVTGPRAIEQISERLGRPLPAVLITGDTAPERLREATASGLLLLHKPLEPDTLLRALNRCLQRVDQSRGKATRQAS